jgi:hypothetical protein
VIAYRATLDVPGELMQFVAELLAAGRGRRGTPKGSRALTCFWQAVPGLRWFRDRTAPDALARDHKISRGHGVPLPGRGHRGARRASPGSARGPGTGAGAGLCPRNPGRQDHRLRPVQRTGPQRQGRGHRPVVLRQGPGLAATAGIHASHRMEGPPGASRAPMLQDARPASGPSAPGVLTPSHPSGSTHGGCPYPNRCPVPRVRAGRAPTCCPARRPATCSWSPARPGWSPRAGQASVRPSFTAVPVTGRTLGVMLAGTALGWRRGAAAPTWYAAAGVAGPAVVRRAHWQLSGSLVPYAMVRLRLGTVQGISSTAASVASAARNEVPAGGGLRRDSSRPLRSRRPLLAAGPGRVWQRLGEVALTIHDGRSGVSRHGTRVRPSRRVSQVELRSDLWLR